MTYTATIATNAGRNIGHTFHADSDAAAIVEARRVEVDTQRKLGGSDFAGLDRLVRHDGTPTTEIDLY